MTKKIIEGVKSIMNNKKKCIYLGNIDSKRDWGHANDYVYGMWLMLQQEGPDDYVLSTGKTYTVREFVERSFAYHSKNIYWEGEGLQEVGKIGDKIVVRIDKKYYRPNEVDLLLGDSTKAKEKLGWEAKYQLDDIIKDMFS